MTDDILRRIGWGPFPVPGEKRRRQLRMQKYSELETAMTTLEHPDLDDPDLDDLDTRHDRYVADLLQYREHLLRCTGDVGELECVEDELAHLGVEF